METTSKTSVKSFISKLGPWGALIVLVLIVTILNPGFLNINNIFNLLRQVSINAIIAFAMTFVILTGGIDLSVGSILAFSTAITAQLIVGGVPTIIAVIAGILLGGVSGAINGLIITKGGAAPFIVTLATMTIFRGATYVFTNGSPITGAKITNNYSFQVLGRGYVLGIPVPVLIMFAAFVVLYILLHRMSFGRKTYAIGGNAKAAFVSGIKTDKVLIWIYTISGAAAALAGMILTSRLSSAQPDAGTGYEMDAIASVVLGGTSLAGGKGRIVGTFVGALIIGVLNNGMNLLGISSFYQQIVKGIVILIAVLLDRKKTKA
ncbi:ribose ABC transporter permease [Oenococcus sicerae]|uniref:Ribose ABC transporter permease n=1 Tax=Oenococcus sicerae TaxID=2203724 RepID=A0AAJ1R8S0_9LACO|nr:ribose ABC transporter permease [Oenococcus sicerae]MDN6900123.1 ribose ABC transporter permease [Oenococcus sicerae]QAS69731.1 ribose ABC transporter permease [Oenococcus sicerae]VDK13954.1 Ribose import permease protein RbsC {ECO:0000305} [Oenococcus sicerae]